MLVVTLALVEDDGRILLIQEANPNCYGQWFLPGGRLDPGESLSDCVKREVREEAGLDVEPLGILYIDQTVAGSRGGQDRMRFVFKARAAGGTLKTAPDTHSLRAQWFQREEIAGLPLRSPIVKTILALSDRAPALLPMSSLQTLT